MRTMLPLLALLLLAPAVAAATTDATDVVAEAVRTTLLARSAGLTGDVELTVLGRRAAPADDVQLRVGDVAGRWPRARVAVPVGHWQDGRLLRTQTVWVAVRWWRTLDVYATDEAAGASMPDVRVTRTRVDIAGIGGEPVAADTLAADLRLAQPVRRGRPLLATDFEPMPAVRRGDDVDVEVVRGAIALRARGRALADGGIGDVVVVAFGEGRAPVNARVLSAKAVRVED